MLQKNRFIKRCIKNCLPLSSIVISFAGISGCFLFFGKAETKAEMSLESVQQLKDLLKNK